MPWHIFVFLLALLIALARSWAHIVREAYEVISAKRAFSGDDLAGFLVKTIYY